MDDWSPLLDSGAANVTYGCANDSAGVPAAAGFAAAAVSVLFFGSNFIPVKKFQTGDGMFFQWVLCVAIWSTGFVFTAVRSFPKLYPLAMLGGLLWATGNLMTVPIIKTLGLGLGMLIWGSFNLLSGWATDRFGLFGTTAAKLEGYHSTLNYIGVALAAGSAFIFIFVKPDVNDDQVANGTTYEREPLIPPIVDEYGSVNQKNVRSMDEVTFVNRLTSTQKRIIGIVMAIISGICYGMNFTPVVYIKDRYPHKQVDEGNGVVILEPSCYDFDYVFSHFSGILITSTFYFIVYCIVKKNKPNIYPNIILPAFISGIMWAIADIAWFYANDALDEAVSFPIITTGPGVIAALWGVFVFKEVKGRNNYIVLALAATVAISGAIVSGFSKG